MSETLKIFGQEFSNVAGIIATNDSDEQVTYTVGGGGSSGSMDDPVRFFDYDGTLLHSYSAADFAALTAMPANPTHTGLTSQGWNWSLADAKAQVTAMGACDIGQMYITDDGKTRVYLKFTEERRSPYLALCPNGTVTIDWGDDSATDTLTGSSLTTLKRVQHVYPSAGSYVMTLTATSGTFAFYGTSDVPSFLRYDAGTSSTTGYKSRVYLNSIQRVELGSGVSIKQYAFYNCYSLASITIPDSVTSIGSYTFYQCYSLASITIPDGVTSIGDYVFFYCSSLTSITIPDGVTSIGVNAVQYCYFLTSITIPDSVTSIGNNVFQTCLSLASITIPDGVTSIRKGAIQYCYSLTSVTIPDSVTSIGNTAFYQCYSLVSVTIPDSVTSIGTQAFYYCYGLAEIHFEKTTPPTVSSSNAWSGLNTDCKIYVPYSEDHSILALYTGGTNYPSSSTYTYVEEST